MMQKMNLPFIFFTALFRESAPISILFHIKTDINLVHMDDETVSISSGESMSDEKTSSIETFIFTSYCF